MFGQSLLSGAFGSAACTTDTDQLFATDVTATTIATYQLNNATTSIPDNNYPGTFTTPAYVTGKFGNAATFNGTTSRINTGYYQNGQIYSVSFWAKNLNGDSVFRDTPSSGGGDTRMDVTVTATKGVGLGANIGLVPSFTPNSTIWNHYVVSLDGSTAKIYANGVEVGSKSYTPRTGYAGSGSAVNPVCMMSNGLYPAGFGSGNLDQVRIFNTAIPQAAVTALYNETVATSSSADVNYVNANPNSIAYYKMTDATDQLGNYNGTANNVNFNTEGKFGFAGSFNGSNADIDLPSNIDSTTMSISFWIYIDSIVTGNEVVIELENGYGVWFLSSAGGKLGMQSSNANSAHTLSNSQLSAGAWHHVAAVWNSGSRTFYIDNTVQSGGSVADYLTCNENTIGSRRSGEFLDGKLDQIRIYDSAISAADVTTLYKEIECPEATIVNSFNTVIYTGNGGTQAISTVGFAPDLVWIKERNGTDRHILIDSIRGKNSQISSNSAAAETTYSSNFTSFDSNGFTLGSASESNGNNDLFVAWSWKGGGTAVSNTDGTIASSVSANQAAGFSIASYTSTGTNGSTFGHGLNAIPELVLLKCKDAGGTNWIVGGSILGNDYYLSLNSGNARQSSSNWLVPSATTLQLNQTFGNANTSGREYITYNFTSIPGYSRVGSYIGTGGSLTVYVGFEPSFVMIKRSDASGNWVMVDNKRGNGDNRLYANLTNAEDPGQGESFTSTGFSPRNSSNSDTNISGGNYIYLAIA